MSTFQERQKSLFHHLKDAEEQYSFSKTNKISDFQDYGTVDRTSYRKVKHEMKQFRGRESIFKRPEASIRQCLRAKTVPGYINDPKKWKYYSLSDVTEEQMSDATNTATALASIRRFEQEDKNKMDITENDEIFKKPVFHASSIVKKAKESEDKPVFKGNKLVMPEYVIGSSKKEKKVKERSIPKEEDTSQRVVLQLDHLLEDCDEEA